MNKIIQELDNNLANSGIKLLEPESDSNDHLYNNILIYQMGKVASETIRVSLDEYGFKNLFKPHTVRLDIMLDNIDRGINTTSSTFTLNTYFAIKNNLIDKSKIITIVRKPIEKAISNFFYMYTTIHDKEIRDLKNLEKIKSKLNRSHEIGHSVNWYNQEFKVTTGVDLLYHKFDLAKGYTIYNIKGYEILVLKVETDDSIKEKGINEFLGLDDFKIIRSNESKTKPYSELYNQFKEYYRIDNRILNDLCNTQYVKTFYSADEIDAMKKRWSSGKNFSFNHYITNFIRRKRF